MSLDMVGIGLEIKSQGLKQGINDLDKLGQSGVKTERSLDKTSQSMSKFSGIASAAAAVLSGLAVNSIIKVADSYAAMNGQLLLVTDSTQEFIDISQRLNVVSMQTYASQSYITKLYSTMQPALEQMGKSTSDTLRFVETFNKALALTSPTATESQSAILQFSQAMGSGVLRGDEFNSMMENGRGVMQSLADGMGKPIGELRKLAEAGKLTSDVVYAALARSAQQIDDKFNKLPMTVGKAMTTLETGILNFVGSADKATGSSESLANVINTLGLNLNESAQFWRVFEVASKDADASIQGVNSAAEASKTIFEEYKPLLVVVAENAYNLGLAFKQLGYDFDLMYSILTQEVKSGMFDELGKKFSDYENKVEVLQKKSEEFSKSFRDNAAKGTGGYIKSIDDELKGIFGLSAIDMQDMPKIDNQSASEIKAAQKSIDARRKLYKDANDERYDDWESSLDKLSAYEQSKADEATKLYEQMRTPIENLNVEWAKYDQMLADGSITWETYSRAVMGAYDNMSKSSDTSTKEQQDNIRQLQQAIDGWGKDSARAIADFAISGKLSFSDLASSIIKDLITMAAYQSITKPLFGAISGAFTGGMDWSSGSSIVSAQNASFNANGNAFGGSGIQMFANGGTFTNSVVNSPTAFKFAKGGGFSLGVMGEAGAEAVMPLTRNNGRLGVDASGVGGGNVVVNVINNTSNDTQATATVRDNGGMQVIDIVVDKVKTALAGDLRNNGSFAQSISGAYGLQRRV